MSYLHSKGIILKYLTPQNIIALQGFDPDQAIKLKLVDLPILQLIDVIYPKLHKKIFGVDRMFMAPEIIQGNQVVSAKADTWTLGVILYIIITGGVTEDENSD